MIGYGKYVKRIFSKARFEMQFLNGGEDPQGRKVRAIHFQLNSPSNTVHLVNALDALSINICSLSETG